MSTTYKSRAGDTFSLIAQQTMGVDTGASEIKRANPGISEPIRPGTSIRIPVDWKNKKGFSASGLDVKVDGQPIITMPNFTLSTQIDAIRKASFTVPNEGATRALLPPLSQLDCVVGYNGSTTLTGRINTPQPQASETSKSLVVGAYSACALCENSPPPLTAFPMEFERMSLKQIAEQVCETLGIGVVFDLDPGAKFRRVNVKQVGDRGTTRKRDTDVSGDILPFLADLAAQRNFIISDDEFGNLVFWRGEGTGEPILEIDDGVQPDSAVSVSFSDDAYYSSITGVMPSKTRRRGKTYTVQNPFFTGLVRPYTYMVEDIDQGELETAVNSTAARMFAGVFSAEINRAGWTDLNGDRIQVNRLIRFRSPSNYIENWTDLLISGVTLENDEGSETAQVTAVLPSVYSGKMPEVLPWGS